MLSVGATAIGLLLGLYVNGIAQKYSENQTYNNILLAVAAEGTSNAAVLNDSVYRYIDNGVVLRDFSIDSARQAMANPVFVSNASPKILTDVGTYIRDLSLSNDYRAQVAQMSIQSNPKAPNIWLPALKQTWIAQLKDVDADVATVRKLAPR